jgi:hypothetical protein
MYKLPYLQKYKGKSTRYKCPSCGRTQIFTLYLNGNTHEPIHRTVGRCNREIKCGYHYTPKQYFRDNPMSQSSSMSYKITQTLQIPQSPLSSNSQKVNFLSPLGESTRRGIEVGIGGEVPFHYLLDSLSPNSNFVSFLKNQFSEVQINTVFENYLLGATKSKEVIFWQIDINGKIRTGKIMQYNIETGRRQKHESGAIDWVHNKLKKSSQLPEDFNLQQCFFGEHLLTIYPDKTVGIVESEKSAIIASCVIPELIWLAAGSLNGLSVEKCKVLKNRKVILYPDLGAYEKWSEKTKTINLLGLSCSTLLEDIATSIDKIKGFDVADFMIDEIIKIKSEKQIRIKS